MENNNILTAILPYSFCPTRPMSACLADADGGAAMPSVAATDAHLPAAAVGLLGLIGFGFLR